MLEVWGRDTASTTAFLVANSASTTEFAVLDNGNATLAGNLGIGTTSPQAKLDVFGSGIFEGTNNYLNFGTIVGSSGYGFRDNGGIIR